MAPEFGAENRITISGLRAGRDWPTPGIYSRGAAQNAVRRKGVHPFPGPDHGVGADYAARGFLKISGNRLLAELAEGLGLGLGDGAGVPEGDVVRW